MENTTTIEANGSTWYGQSPASIDQLFDLMQHEPLDWERFHEGFVDLAADGRVYIRGNFLRVSHVFAVETLDQALLTRFAAAFLDNHIFSKHFDMDSPIYRVEPPPVFIEEETKEEIAKSLRDRKHDAWMKAQQTI